MLHRSFPATRLLFAATLICWMFAAASGQETATKQQASPAPGEVNLRASRVYAFVEKTGLGHRHAIEGRLASGNLLLAADSAAGELVFDMRSFDADTSAARQYIGLPGETDASTRSKVNANMKGRDVLNIQSYPTAKFQIDSALPTGRTSQEGLPTYQLQGNFMLHGVTKPLTVIAEVERARGWLHVRGNFVVRQTSYGIKPFSKAFGAIGVADPLRIYGDLWLAPNERVALSEIPARE